MKLKQIVIHLGLAVVLLTGSITAHATNVVQLPAEELDSVYNQEVQSNELKGWVKGPQIYSEAGIVMDIDSGAILYAKNIDAKHYPASITKLLTALVALEHNELTDTVTVKEEDVSFLKYDESHIGLKPGEEITMEDAMHGMLLASGNDVSHAIASNTQGGYENFIYMMNEKAQELGCTNSNFVNPHGLHDDEHYTSARDMALIGAEVFKNEDFRRITKTLEYTIPVTNITNETRTFQQHHRMLYDWRSQYYEFCEGGKTGYTDNALSTLVTFATKDNVNLVAVVLRTHGGGDKTYVDTRAMMEYGFSNFSKMPVTKDMVDAKGIKTLAKDAYVMLPEGISFADLKSEVQYPKKLEDKTCHITYTYKDQVVGKVSATITKEYYNEIHNIKEVKPEPKKEKTKLSAGVIIVRIILILIALVVLFYLFLVGYAAHRKRKRRKRRAEMRRKKRQLEYQKYLRQTQNDD